MGASQSDSTMGQLQLPVIVLARVRAGGAVRPGHLEAERAQRQTRTSWAQPPPGPCACACLGLAPTLPYWQPAASGQIEGLHGALNNGNFAATRATPTKGSHVLGTNANGAPGATFRRPARFSSPQDLVGSGHWTAPGIGRLPNSEPHDRSLPLNGTDNARSLRQMGPAGRVEPRSVPNSKTTAR
jgi:hypothetical protein